MLTLTLGLFFVFFSTTTPSHWALVPVSVSTHLPEKLDGVTGGCVTIGGSVPASACRYGNSGF